MDLKTEAGIEIFIRDAKNSKIIMFDKPVQTIELYKEECARIGASLIRDSKVGLTSDLRKLIDSGYFLESKKFRQVKQELLDGGLLAKPSSLNVILKKMVDRGELLRKGTKGFYQYEQKG